MSLDARAQQPARLQGKLEEAEGVFAAAEKDLLEAQVALYGAWERAEPGLGHGYDAAAWRKRLDGDGQDPR